MYECCLAYVVYYLKQVSHDIIVNSLIYFLLQAFLSHFCFIFFCYRLFLFLENYDFRVSSPPPGKHLGWTKTTGRLGITGQQSDPQTERNAKELRECCLGRFLPEIPAYLFDHLNSSSARWVDPEIRVDDFRVALSANKKFTILSINEIFLLHCIDSRHANTHAKVG